MPLLASPMRLFLAFYLAGCADPAPTVDKGTDAADTDAHTDADIEIDCEPDAEMVEAECPTTDRICASGICAYDLAAVVHTVSGAVTYNGVTPPTNPHGHDYTVAFTRDDGRVYDVDAEGGTYTAQVPGGLYDVTLRLNYDGDAGFTSGTLPVAEAVRIDRDTTLAVSALVHAVTGSVTYNGAAPPTSPDEADSSFLIRFTRDDGRSFAVSGREGTYATHVPSGVYDVTIEAYDREGTNAYPDDSFPVADDVSVSRDTHLDLSAVAHAVSGAVTYDGDPPPEEPYFEDYTVHFTGDDGTAYSIDGEGGTYAGFVPPGLYDVSLELSDELHEPYIFGLIRIAEHVRVDRDLDLDVAAVVHEVAGAVTFNGAPPPSSGYTDYFVRFTMDDGRFYRFGGDDGTYSAHLPLGTYDVTLSFEETGAPEGTYFDVTMPVASGLVVTRDTTLDLAAVAALKPLYTVVGTATYDGAAPPAVRYHDFAVSFEGKDGDEHYAYGNDGAYTAHLPGGLYDVELQINDSKNPHSSYESPAILFAEDVCIANDARVDVDAVLYEITGAVTYNGAAPPTDPHHGDYTVRFSSGVGRSFDAEGDDGAYTARVPAGIYDVTLELTAGDADTYPRSAIALGACIEVGP